MVTEEDIKEYFNEDEWNVMSTIDKDRLIKLTFKIDVFSSDTPSECNLLSDDQNTFNDSGSEFGDYEPGDFLYCDNCKVQYKDYCIQCTMLLQILDVDIAFGIIDRAKKTLPKSILEIKSSPINGNGIFTLKSIPEGVIFGPFDGLDIKEQGSKCSFNVKDVKLFSFEKEKYSNWLGYVNCARHLLEQNLMPFQYDGNLFFQTIRQINKGEELLIFYDTKHYDTSVMFYKPSVKNETKQVYACISCCLGFSFENHLLYHLKRCPNNIQNEISTKIVRCTTCRMFLCNGEYLGGHKNACEEKYNQRLTLFRDRPRTPNIALKFKCTKCVFYTDCSKSFKKHSDAHDSPITNNKEQSNEKYVCGVCKKNFKSSSAFAHHKYIHVEKRFKCETCGQLFRKRSTLKCHELLHTGESRFQCANCDYKCIYKESLESHMRKAHSNMEKKYECKKCDYKTHYRTSMKNHERRHDGIRNYKCEICEKAFITSDKLKEHLLVHTNVREILCSQCEKTFKTNRALKTHILHCHTEKSFKCEFCNFSAVVQEAYDRHLQLFHPKGFVDKKYKCDQCKYQTNDRGNFNKHVNSHNGYRPYVCNICNKGCVSKRDLELHMYSHKETKDFKCAQCDKLFSSKPTLKLHLQSQHSDTKLFKCYQCDYECNRQFSLQLHINFKHNSEENKT